MNECYSECLSQETVKMVKEEGNPGNLAALPTMMDFLDDSDRYEPPDRTQSTNTKHLRTCHSNSCHTTL